MLPISFLKSSVCKLWELDNGVWGCGGDHLQFNPSGLLVPGMKGSSGGSIQMPPGEGFPPEQAWRSWIPLHSWTTCWPDHRIFSAGLWAAALLDLQRDVLPEPQYYRGFGFKLSVSSMFSLFHYLCLKGLQKHPCSDGWKPALHVFISSSCGADLCQVSPST